MGNKIRETRSGTRKAATMDDIARIAATSKSTVSRALQGDPRVKPATRERIVALANSHGYSVNSNARKLWQKRSNAIAVVIHLPPHADPRWSGPFVFQLLADVANGLWLRRQDLLLCSPESDRSDAYQSMIASKGVDGIIFLGQGANDGWLTQLVRTRAPFVVWGAVEENPRYCTVGSDNFKGGLLAGRRFNTLDRRRALFVGNREHREMAQRWQGFNQALAEHTSAEPSYLEVPDFSFDTALRYISAYLDAEKYALPDAIFGGSDEIAGAAIVALQDRGIRVPDQVSVIGYDDAPSASHMRPALTTVRQDTRLAGSLLVESLFQLIDGGRPPSVSLPTELVIRET